MKTTLISLIAALTVVTASETAHADKPGTFGIGIGGGTISTGLSLKYYTGSSFALQGNVGLLGSGRDRFAGQGIAVSVDGLLEQSSLYRNQYFSLDWNFGLGGGVGVLSDTLILAAAGVIGLEFNFIPIPIDFVVEYRPTLQILNDVNLDPIDFSGHVRFYF